MNIVSLELFHVAMPLKSTIKHASHARESSDNLVARVTLANGVAGYGEGVPRAYVTGETITSTFETLSKIDLARSFGAPRDFEDVVRGLESLVIAETLDDPRGMRGNAARCALELAVLDAYGRHFGKSIADAVRLVDVEGVARNAAPTGVRYSGAITADDPRRERISAWKMRLYGFHQVKVKVGVEGQDDAARLAKFRRILGNKVDLRLDANEAWPARELQSYVEPLLRFRPSALEQPCPHEQLEEMAAVKSSLGVPIMLDESLCGLPDARRAVALRAADVFNIRISKCGGIVASLRLTAIARAAGIAIQLGCHPGESGLLSAAGRHFAGIVQNITYLEGSYDRHVLARNLIVEDVTLGYGGRARPIAGPGLGVTIEAAALADLTTEQRTIKYD